MIINNNINKGNQPPSHSKTSKFTRKCGVCRCLGHVVPVVKWTSQQNENTLSDLSATTLSSTSQDEFQVDEQNKCGKCPECYSTVEAHFIPLGEHWKVIYHCENKHCRWVSDIIDATRIPKAKMIPKITSEKFFYCCCDYKAEKPELCMNMETMDEIFLQVNLQRCERLMEIPCPLFDSFTEIDRNFTEEYPYFMESSLSPK